MISWHDFASLLTATYVFLFLAVAGVVVFVLRSWVWKLIGLLVVLAAFTAPLLRSHIQETKRLEHNHMIAERFAKLCRENAGEKIFRTVEDVDGFLIMRPRQPTKDHKEYMDQYWMGDPYGHSDLEAKEPEAVFLMDRKGYERSGLKISAIAGYNYIELKQVNPEKPDQPYLRITVSSRTNDRNGEHLTYTRSFSARANSRYAYDWQDISTPEDRRFWIAGGRLRILDLETQTLLAERVGYVMDREQGAGIAGGSPWLLAQRNACPSFEDMHTKAKEFVAKVLRPAREVKRD